MPAAKGSAAKAAAAHVCPTSAVGTAESASSCTVGSPGSRASLLDAWEHTGVRQSRVGLHLRALVELPPLLVGGNDGLDAEEEEDEGYDEQGEDERAEDEDPHAHGSARSYEYYC